MKFFSLVLLFVVLMSLVSAAPPPHRVGGTRKTPIDKRSEIIDLLEEALESLQNGTSGFFEELASELLEDLSILDHIGSGVSSKLKESFVLDLFTGQKLSSYSTHSSGNQVTFINYANGTSSTLGQYECLNHRLENPNSGVCGFTGCSYSGSANCTEEYYDCCIALATDYNGRSECSQAICKRTSVLAAPYKNGGCCRGGSLNIG